MFPSFYYEKSPLVIKYGGNDQELDRIEAHINEYEQKLNIGDEDWVYLNDNGNYVKFDDGPCGVIENKYKELYLVLLEEPGYQDYSEYVEIQYKNRQYQIRFARIGGVHCQVTKVSQNSVRNSEIEKILGDKNLKEFNFEHETTRIVKRRNETEVQSIRPVYWKWKHESGVFRPYEKDADFLIEYYYQQFLRKRENNLVMIQGSNGKTYMICFEPLLQFNEETRFKRPIKREVV
jgi:hypothetical protein